LTAGGPQRKGDLVDGGAATRAETASFLAGDGGADPVRRAGLAQANLVRSKGLTHACD
jgi:hypothetical protein